MGCWLKSRRGATFLLRDGRGTAAPMRKVGCEPVWFAALDPANFEYDCNVAPVPDLTPPSEKALTEREAKEAEARAAAAAKSEPPPAQTDLPQEKSVRRPQRVITRGLGEL